MCRCWVLVLVGCFSPQLSETPTCGPGDRCPSGQLCLNGSCVTSECGDAENGTECSTRAVPDGRCFIGACHAKGCGDGLLEAPSEVCDDGNVNGADGCGPTCESLETCGNGVVDLAVGEDCDDGSAIALTHDGCSATCSQEFESWQDLTPNAPPSHNAIPPMAYDPDRRVAVMLGVGGTWEWNGASWRRRTPLHEPPYRYRGTMAYDTITKRIVLFGGRRDQPPAQDFDDTWTWDGADWTQQFPAQAPSARSVRAMAFDEARGRVVLFGGSSGSSPSRETWTYDGVNWRQESPVTIPDIGGTNATIAYDRARQVVVLAISGASSSWEWNGVDWNVIPPPPSRTGTLVYDSAGSQILAVSNRLAMDAWNGTSWTTLATAPHNHTNHATVYDSARRKVIIYAGHHVDSLTPIEDVWESGTGDVGWTVISPRLPEARSNPAMTYDPDRGRSLMFGGSANNIARDDTWELVGSTWIHLPLDIRPPSRQTAQLATDRPNGVLLFGGFGVGTVALNDTWRFNGGWVQLNPPTSPPARGSHAMAYDPAHRRIVMFGGRVVSSSITFGDTWVWNGSTWSELVTASAPPPASNANLVYDASREVLVLIANGETWELDANSWVKKTPAVSPSSRLTSFAAYDAARKRVVLSGGLGAQGTLTDTWEWNGEIWEERIAAIGEIGRYAGASVYDAVNKRTVIFGGFEPATQIQFSDLRVYSYLAADRIDETCTSEAIDGDRDQLLGCADPDCWGRCFPHCPPGVGCDMTLPHCGDGACNVDLEDRNLCPMDCGA